MKLRVGGQRQLKQSHDVYGSKANTSANRCQWETRDVLYYRNKMKISKQINLKWSTYPYISMFVKTCLFIWEHKFLPLLFKVWDSNKQDNWCCCSGIQPHQNDISAASIATSFGFCFQIIRFYAIHTPTFNFHIKAEFHRIINWNCGSY